MSSKLISIVSLVALLAASSSADAQARKKGRGKGKATTTESSSSSSSSSSLPPSSLVEPTLPPAASTPPPPPPVESKPKAAAAESAPPEADSPPDTDSDKPRPELLPLIRVGLEPLWEGRIFRHQEFTQPALREYRGVGYPAVELSAELFPFVNMRSKFLRGLGVDLHYARAIAFQSDSTRLGGSVDAAEPVDTSFSRYSAGLRYRILMNPASETPFVFGVSASLGRWLLDFGPQLPRDVDLEVPTANYRMIRVAFDGAFQVKRVTLYGTAAYLHVFDVVSPSARELDTLTYAYLANAPGMGGEFRGAVGVRVTPWLELRASVEYALIGFHLKPLEGRTEAPARVLDSYLSAGLGPYVNF